MSPLCEEALASDNVMTLSSALAIFTLEEGERPTKSQLNSKHRRLALLYHPDASDAKDATETMAKINLAKALLESWIENEYVVDVVNETDADPFADAQAADPWFGTSAPPNMPQRGKDRTQEIEIEFLEAKKGCHKVVGSKSDPATIRIRAGARDGQIYRVRGHGFAGTYGGENGDLLVTITVLPP